DDKYPKDKVDKYENLVLMCSVHHKVIDDQPGYYTVESLNNIKKDHEKWVRESLDKYDAPKQRDDEIYATYAEQWVELAHIETWQAWSSFVLGSGQPRLRVDVSESFDALRDWLLSRIWPHRYTELENSFENFRRVLQDFQNTFHIHAVKTNDIFYTEKFYKIDEWNEDKYEKLANRYDFHVDLVMDLMMELTRAANYICDKIRTTIDPTFRIKEGALLVVSGPYEDFSWSTHRIEYRASERTDIPYPGLEKFKTVRKERDYRFGVGVNSKDPEFLKANE
ncbi:MAG: hypothetical protein ACYDGO_05620, partial [Smithellaceae bacterium]